MARCFGHMRGAVQHLYGYPSTDLPKIAPVAENGRTRPVHCARAVLQGITDRTGVGHPPLERISVVLDGGVGLQGGVCGALTGAILGLGLVVGRDIRATNMLQNLQASVVCHINLLLDHPIGTDEPFGVGRPVVERFRAEAGDTACRSITGKRFDNWSDFQRYLATADTCHHLIDRAVTLSSRAIELATPKPFTPT